MDATETALVVRVPEADPVVGRFRALLDSAAPRGVPAHVTVLYPFLPPERIDIGVLADLAEITAAVPSFDLVLDSIEWFDEDVVWLAPRPDMPFRALTAAVYRRWPDAPPYSGVYENPTPHLTVGHDQPRQVLAAAADALAASLPISSVVTSVSLLAGSPAPNGWRMLCDFPLGPCSRS